MIAFSLQAECASLKTIYLTGKVQFVPALNIGNESMPAGGFFEAPIGITSDTKGNVYICDAKANNIKKFDAQGKYLLSIGRPGQGPGEFQNVWHPRFDKDENLYVSDIYGSRSRISVFDRQGNSLKTIRVPIRLRDVYINSTGSFLGYQSIFLEDPKGDLGIYCVGLFDESFNCIKKLHEKVYESNPSAGQGANSRAQFLANLLGDEAFKPTWTYVLAEDDFIYFGYPENYEINIYSPEGKLKKIILREYDPIKIGKKHIQGFIRYQENEFFRFIQTTDDIKEKVFKLIEYPKFKPAYDTFTLMDNGWIAVIVDYIENEYTLIDLFDQQGTYIAQFEAKIPIQNLFFKNGKAYALAIENDFRYVKRYNFEIQEMRNNKWVAKKQH